MGDKRYRNRIEAGRALAPALAAYAGSSSAIVLALPRGGVPVGFALAASLGLPLDVLVVRKLGCPDNEEFAIGAIGSNGVCELQSDILAALGIDATDLRAVIARELAEVARRERRYRGRRGPLQLAGKTAILVDDGLATGSTMLAAVAVARACGAARIVVAVPVGAVEACVLLAPKVDELICPRRPAPFRAVSMWYRSFEQTSDDEVDDFLALAWQNLPAAGPGPPSRPMAEATPLPALRGARLP